MKIGIGITTHNRNDILLRSFDHICRYAPKGAKIAVVDDASVVPVSLSLYENTMAFADHVPIYRFNDNVGIAAAKNKCFELLDDCDHIFLFDDDFYPVAPGWWKPYVQSPEPHLMYIFQDFPKGPKLHDTIKIYEDEKIVSYSHPRGCMMYFHRSCLELVGGMDTVYGKWGYEHPNLSDRIYNNGLTRFRYMDVPDSGKLFYSGDEHRTVKSTVWGKDRVAQIERNKRIYEANVNSTAFIPYRTGQLRQSKKLTALGKLIDDIKKFNEILTCYFTGVPDPQRVGLTGGLSSAGEAIYTALSPLYLSTNGKVNTVFFHDTPNFLAWGRWDIRDLEPIKINPYWQRWVTYREYLIKNRDHLGFVWCVDATDVEMLRDPFPHMEHGKLYVGDEPGNIGGNVWLTRHHKHPMLQAFFRNNFKPLLNAGLVGGDVETMIEFTGHMIDVYQRCEHDAQIKGWPNSGMTDMGALNFVVYTHFKGRFSHGKHVNTQFKGYEADNGVSFWRHK